MANFSSDFSVQSYNLHYVQLLARKQQDQQDQHETVRTVVLLERLLVLIRPKGISQQTKHINETRHQPTVRFSLSCLLFGYSCSHKLPSLIRRQSFEDKTWKSCSGPARSVRNQTSAFPGPTKELNKAQSCVGINWVLMAASHCNSCDYCSNIHHHNPLRQRLKRPHRG